MKSVVERRALEMLRKVGAKVDKYDLAAFAPCDPRTAQRILKRIHLAVPDIKIVAWNRCYQLPIPAYGVSQRSDKPRPKSMTNAQRQRKYRKDPEYSMRCLVRERSRRFRQQQQSAAMAAAGGAQ